MNQASFAIARPDLSLTIEILRNAKAKLEQPGAWIKEKFATDGTHTVAAHMNEAKCFCALGAIDNARGQHPLAQFTRAGAYLQHALREIEPDLTVPEYNDDPFTELKHILDLYDRAIALAEVAYKSQKAAA